MKKNLKSLYDNFSFFFLHLRLLPGENWFKNKFNLSINLLKEGYCYTIHKNSFSYSFLITSLLYPNDLSHLFVEQFNYYQSIPKSSLNYPYLYNSSLKMYDFLKEMENLHLIKIVAEKRVSAKIEIYFNKIDSFKEENLFLLFQLAEDLNIDCLNYKVINLQETPYLKTKKKYIWNQIRSGIVLKRIQEKREEFYILKEMLQNYLLNKEQKDLTRKK